MSLKPPILPILLALSVVACDPGDSDFNNGDLQDTTESGVVEFDASQDGDIDRWRINTTMRAQEGTDELIVDYGLEVVAIDTNLVDEELFRWQYKDGQTTFQILGAFSGFFESETFILTDELDIEGLTPEEAQAKAFAFATYTEILQQFQGDYNAYLAFTEDHKQRAEEWKAIVTSGKDALWYQAELWNIVDKGEVNDWNKRMTIGICAVAVSTVSVCVGGLGGANITASAAGLSLASVGHFGAACVVGGGIGMAACTGAMLAAFDDDSYNLALAGEADSFIGDSNAIRAFLTSIESS